MTYPSVVDSRKWTKPGHEAMRAEVRRLLGLYCFHEAAPLHRVVADGHSV